MKHKRDFDWLQKEKHLLKEECRQHSDAIGQSLHYAQHHFGEVLIESIFNVDRRKRQTVSSAMSKVYEVIGKIFPQSHINEEDTKARRWLKLGELMFSAIFMRDKEKGEE